MAAGHHSHADGSHDDHEEETFSTAPKIEDLGQRDEDSGLHAAGHDVDDGDEGVRLPFADGVRLQRPVDARLEAVCEVDEPHAVDSLLAKASRKSTMLY